MEISLKLEKAKHLKEAELELIDAVDDGQDHYVILTTNNKDVQMDKRDARLVSALKGVKVVYKTSNGKALILFGNIECHFVPPFGGKFYVRGAYLENTEYSEISGVHID